MSILKESLSLRLALVAGTILAGAPLLSYAVCNTSIAAHSPDERFVANGELVTDTATGLMWKRCPEGLSGATCNTGAAIAENWEEALAHVAVVNTAPATLGAGHSDWRLPNRNELASLVERKCVNPAINEAIFPGTPSTGFWTSSPSSQNAVTSWVVDFNVGNVSPTFKANQRNIRLVRGGN